MKEMLVTFFVIFYITYVIAEFLKMKLLEGETESPRSQDEVDEDALRDYLKGENFSSSARIGICLFLKEIGYSDLAQLVIITARPGSSTFEDFHEKYLELRLKLVKDVHCYSTDEKTARMLELIDNHYDKVQNKEYDILDLNRVKDFSAKGIDFGDTICKYIRLKGDDQFIILHGDSIDEDLTEEIYPAPNFTEVLKEIPYLIDAGDKTLSIFFDVDSTTFFWECGYTWTLRDKVIFKSIKCISPLRALEDTLEWILYNYPDVLRKREKN